jgi:antitoxin component of RelBE/YafQ-DinJ toxin-antitoxin module
MGAAMVTGRMDADKKERGNRILSRDGMTASQAINLMYDRLLSDQSTAFLSPESERPSQAAWARAAYAVDSISEPQISRFNDMSRAEIKVDRLRSRGLM